MRYEVLAIQATWTMNGLPLEKKTTSYLWIFLPLSRRKSIFCAHLPAQHLSTVRGGHMNWKSPYLIQQLPSPLHEFLARHVWAQNAPLASRSPVLSPVGRWRAVAREEVPIRPSGFYMPLFPNSFVGIPFSLLKQGASIFRSPRAIQGPIYTSPDERANFYHYTTPHSI